MIASDRKEWSACKLHLLVALGTVQWWTLWVTCSSGSFWRPKRDQSGLKERLVERYRLKDGVLLATMMSGYSFEPYHKRFYRAKAICYEFLHPSVLRLCLFLRILLWLTYLFDSHLLSDTSVKSRTMLIQYHSLQGLHRYSIELHTGQRPPNSSIPTFTLIVFLLN